MFSSKEGSRGYGKGGGRFLTSFMDRMKVGLAGLQCFLGEGTSPLQFLFIFLFSFSFFGYETWATSFFTP